MRRHNKMLDYLKKSWEKAKETYRTDPLAETTLGFSGLALLVSTYTPLVIGVAAASVISGYHIRNRFREKKEIEELVLAHRDDASALIPYMKWWCSRQVAKVIAEKHNILDKYEEAYQFCKNKSEKHKLRFSFIPHI